MKVAILLWNDILMDTYYTPSKDDTYMHTIHASPSLFMPASSPLSISSTSHLHDHCLGIDNKIGATTWHQLTCCVAFGYIIYSYILQNMKLMHNILYEYFFFIICNLLSYMMSWVHNIRWVTEHLGLYRNHQLWGWHYHIYWRYKWCFVLFIGYMILW